MSNKTDKSLVLVGFGEYDLSEMLLWIGTSKEEDLLTAPENWVPRFRRAESCSVDELSFFIKYVEWCSEALNRIDLNNAVKV